MKHRMLLIALLASVTVGVAFAQTINFDKDKEGVLPKGFSASLTGKGKQGNWVVLNDTAAPSKPNVLAQTDMDQTDYRFPLCIFDSVIATDVDIAVHFKPVKGSVDQAGGIVWRYQDSNNYYVLRVNALENNFRMYHVVAGKRQEFAGAKVKVTSSQWHTIRVHNVENKFEAYVDDKKLIEATDTTFKRAGKIGLWTKADSHTLFDDLTIHVLRK
ncbi:MAG: hypothetical protein HY707_10575 [Ignavibacteriae bacterium]|nr:hypothetical protein [Ignavibacteriota bacterium]